MEKERKKIKVNKRWCFSLLKKEVLFIILIISFTTSENQQFVIIIRNENVSTENEG
jgi:hypothetical protein